MAEEIFDPLRRTVEGVATGVGDVVGGIGKGISSAVGGVGDAVGGLLGGFQNMPADDRMALINTLGRTGAALMALGQPGYNPKLRQQAVMALGNVPGQVQTDRFNSIKAKVAQANMQQIMSNLRGLRRISDMQNTPEGLASLSKLTGMDNQQVISSLSPSVLQQIIVKQQTRPFSERITQAMLAPALKQAIAGGSIGSQPAADREDVAAQPTATEAASPSQPTAQGGDITQSPLFPIMRLANPKMAEALLKTRPATLVAKEKEEAEKVKSFEGDTRSMIATKGVNDAIFSAIEDARNEIGPLTVGITGLATSKVTASPRKNIAAAINTVKSNLSIENLQRLRKESGGGLGNITNQDLVTLQSTIATLDPDMSEAAFRKSLNKIESVLKKRYEISKYMFEKKYKTPFDERRFGGESAAGDITGSPAQSQAATVSTKAQYDALPLGAIYIGPDGGTYRKR